MKFKTILSLKSLIVLGFVIAVIPLFLAVMYAAFGMRETSALGRTINTQVFEQTKAVRQVLQKTGNGSDCEGTLSMNRYRLKTGRR